MLRMLSIVIWGSMLCLTSWILYERYVENEYVDIHPLDQASQYLEGGQPFEAKLMAQWVANYRPDLDHENQAEQVIKQAEVDIKESRTTEFFEGMATGEADSLAGIAGSATLDLFVVGDIRDILVQGYKEVTHEDGDKIILALSALGLATTFAPIADWIPSLMKAFKRAGAFSGKMIKNLAKISTEALKTKNFAKLSKVSTNIGQVASGLGVNASKNILKNLDTPADISKLASAVKVSPEASFMVYKQSPKMVAKLNKNGSNLLKLSNKIKVASRLSKFVVKFGGIIPVWGLIVILYLSAVMFFRALFIFKKKA